MSFFEGEIARAVVLALFVPLIISSGGNCDSQAASLIIRALALRGLKLRDWFRVFRREPSGSHGSVNDPVRRSRLKIHFVLRLGIRYASHLGPVVNRIRPSRFRSVLKGICGGGGAFNH